MNIGAIFMMTISFFLVISLTVFCVYKTLSVDITKKNDKKKDN